MSQDSNVDKEILSAWMSCKRRKEQEHLSRLRREYFERVVGAALVRGALSHTLKQVIDHARRCGVEDPASLVGDIAREWANDLPSADGPEGAGR